MGRAQWILVPVLVAGACAALSVPPVATVVGRALACGHPADILDLANWKETLPTGSPGHPTEVKQPELKTYSADPWFTPNAQCNGVQFRAAVDGVTTSGSAYPRSELREMTDNGSHAASWSTNSGTSTMEIDEAITHLPQGNAHMVAGQIHNQDHDVTVFKLEGSKLYVTNNNDAHYKLVTDNYQLGTRFKVKFVVSGGQVKAYYNDRLAATVPVNSSGDYFKAGGYTQANCHNSSPCAASNYGEVVIYGLTVSHQN
ncbi:MAG: polysaccharide lyase family 7 protein [Pseudonocardiaceae bacterium]